MKQKNKNETQSKSTEELEREEQQSSEESKKKIKKLKRYEKTVKQYQSFVLRLVLFLLVLWILFFQIIGLTRMPNGDMYPRIDSGDMILFYRLDKTFKAQNIVVFEKTTPDSEKKQLFVSRVVAVPGDTVEISESGHLVVNGNTMAENNIFYSTYMYEGHTDVYPLTLGEGEYFVLADHRSDGADSRYFGPVNQSEIIGSVITIVRRNNL